MLCCQKEMGKNGVSGAVGAVGEVQAAEAWDEELQGQATETVGGGRECEGRAAEAVIQEWGWASRISVCGGEDSHATVTMGGVQGGAGSRS